MNIEMLFIAKFKQTVFMSPRKKDTFKTEESPTKSR